MRVAIKIVLFIIIVAAGWGISKLLSSSREPPDRQDKGETATIIAAQVAENTQKPVIVTAMGSVMPARQVTIFPEVPGRIVYQHPELMPGGRFRKGEVILRVDPRDYDLAIRQQRAQVSTAELKLAQEQSLKAVAEKEWELLKGQVEPTQQGRSLALREIQLENAKVGVESAKSFLEKAELARSRASIRAPFNAVVVDEFVDKGQVVGNATRVAVLADADKFWVRASVPVDRLAWIQLPGINADRGSQVKVVQQAGQGMSIERSGRVIRLLSDLDPKGKMARVLVEVDQPLTGQQPGQTKLDNALGDAAPAKGAISPMLEGDAEAGVATPAEQVRTAIPLFLGSYVTVHIQGPQLDRVLSLPRMALRDRNRVWVQNPEDKLEIREVAVVWSRGDVIFVSGNLKPGEKVITSRISTPVEGMLVKTNGHSGPAAKEGQEDPQAEPADDGTEP